MDVLTDRFKISLTSENKILCYLNKLSVNKSRCIEGIALFAQISQRAILVAISLKNGMLYILSIISFQVERSQNSMHKQV